MGGGSSPLARTTSINKGVFANFGWEESPFIALRIQFVARPMDVNVSFCGVWLLQKGHWGNAFYNESQR